MGVAGRYDVGVAFVADDNPLSLRTRVDRLGMDRVGALVFSEELCHILAVHVSAPGANRFSQVL